MGITVCGGKWGTMINVAFPSPSMHPKPTKAQREAALEWLKQYEKRQVEKRIKFWNEQ